MTEGMNEFLSALYGEGNGQIEVRPIVPDRGPASPTFHDDVLGAGVSITRANAAEQNVYVGVALRDPAGPVTRTVDGEEKQFRGGKDNLTCVNAVWVDIDDADSVRALPEKIKTFPLKPGMSVWSGGGYHFYWFLDEPLDLTDMETVEIFEDALRGVCSYFGGDRAATDASRILRVPGTTNYPDSKKKAKGRVVAPCELKRIATANRYAFDEFDTFVQRGKTLRESMGIGSSSAPVSLPTEMPERVRAVLEEDEDLSRLLRGALTEREKKRWPSDSELDFALAQRFAAVPPLLNPDVEAALRLGRGIRRAKAKHDGYFRLTVEKAMQSQRKGEQIPGRESDRAAYLRWALRFALEISQGYKLTGSIDGSQDPQIDPFMTGIEAVDRHGGLHGFSVLSGEPGTGKTLVAIQAGALAVLNGWEVIYNAGEMRMGEMRARLRRAVARLEVPPAAAMEHFHFGVVRPGVTLEEMVMWNTSAIGSSSKRVLLIFDSVNTIARWFAADLGFKARFEALSRLTTWMMLTCLESDCLVSVLALSELNSGGDEWGKEIRYSADAVLRLNAEEGDTNTIQPLLVKDRLNGKTNFDWHRLDYYRGGLVPSAAIEPSHSGEEMV